MAETRLTNVIVPSVFTGYALEPSIYKSRFWLSGAVQENPVISGFLAGGGTTFNLPYWKDTAGTSGDIPSETVATTVNNATSGKQVARRQLREKAWGANDISAIFAGEDPLGALTARVQGYWAQAYDQIAVATLRGLIADNIANDAGSLVNDISGIAGAGGIISDSAVIDADFDRGNPSTFNKSTALTVYDSGGNGYLATVYYVKTQNDSQDSPQSKWQTYFYVGDTLVKPALQQSTNTTGSAMYVNKYGDVLPKSDPRVIPSSGTMEMYALDDQSNVRISESASLIGSPYDSAALAEQTAEAATAQGSISLNIAQGTANYSVTYNLTVADRYPEALAKNIENLINDKLNSKGETARVKVEWNPGDSEATPAVEAGFEISNRTGVTAVETVGDGSTGDLSDDLQSISDEAFTTTNTLEFEINVDEMGSPYTINYGLLKDDSDPVVLARNLEIFINNELGNSANSDPRFGIKVAFESDTNSFKFSSGTTGDNSSLVIGKASANAQTILGFPDPEAAEGEPTELRIDPSISMAVRGKASSPAVMRGEVITSNTSGAMRVSSTNKDFFVTLGNISGNIELEPGNYPSMDKLAVALQDAVNTLVDTTTGLKVSGITVGWDATAKRLSFTTGETGEAVSLQISGSADWGLANTEMAYGGNNQWIELKQFTQNGVPQYVKNGEQTEDITELSTKTQWWPVYLDRGELSFDLTGKPLSPLTKMPFETAFLDGGKGALTMSIDFTQSTQYSSAFAVLSQSQDGAPEGELMGLNIGVDGLVNATYSNGSQVSLGKIVLANFSSPSGLRQVGDASYLSSATSGVAKIGEAGSAGFGSIRAGATERANVDLTQELVDLITAQRNFQANAKAIETSSTMTSAIINIRS
jgi:flagellar hook-basal body protein